MSRRRRRIGGIAAAVAVAAGPGVAQAVSVAGAQGAPSADGASLQLAPNDPFGISKFSTPSEPEVFGGQVTRRAAGPGGGASPAAAGAADRVRVDVYLLPLALGHPYPLAFAITDRAGNYSINAEPPADLAAYQDPGGLINATVIYSDLDTGAARTGDEQLEWSAANHTWRRITPDGPGGTTNPQAAVELVAPVSTPALRAMVALQQPASSARCQPDTNPLLSPFQNVAQPPVWVNTADALAEDLDDNDWTIEGDYETVSSTSVDNLDNQSIDASFGADFDGVGLGVSGSKKLSKGTGSSADTKLGFGFSVRNVATSMLRVGPATVDLGRTLNLKYGVDMESTAQLQDCINGPESFAQDKIVYQPAYYSFSVGPNVSTDNGAGFEEKDAGFLDSVPKGSGTGYRQPCAPGLDPSNRTARVALGAAIQRGSGKSESFSNGEQQTLGGSVSLFVAHAGGSLSHAKNSTVATQADVTQTWTNNTSGTKYLCGYKGSPIDTSISQPIVGAGARPDGT